MAINFKLQKMEKYLPQEPYGKYLAAIRVKRDKGFEMRFEHPPGWTFIDFKVFQIYPNENGTQAIMTQVKTTAPAPQPPNRPPLGKLEVKNPVPENDSNGNKVDCAIDTKRKIMAEHNLRRGLPVLYTTWRSVNEYFDPNNPNTLTFIRKNIGIANTVTILNRQNRGYLENSTAPVFDIILQFEDENRDVVLVDPPVRNER